MVKINLDVINVTESKDIELKLTGHNHLLSSGNH